MFYYFFPTVNQTIRLKDITQFLKITENFMVYRKS